MASPTKVKAYPKLVVVVGTLAHMGGAERQALYLIEHLKRLQRCSVDVLTFEDGEALRPILGQFGVNIHVHPYYYRWPKAQRLKALSSLAQMLRFRIKPDALLPFVGIHSKAIAQVWPFTNAQFCWWNQQDEGRDLNGTEVERRILKRVSAVTSNSVAGRDFLASTYDLDPKDILVYNNGTPHLEPVAGDPIRTRLGLGDRKVVSMVANITRFKDHATLLDAWSAIRNYFPESDLPVLLLAGSLTDTSMVARLQMQAFNLGLSSRDVRFLGPVENVIEIFSASDLVVHSSIKEGCPNAVCEAMALGCAVVATDIPGSRQALGAGAVESLVPPRDADALARHIIRMLENDDLRTTSGQKNKQRMRSEFTISGMNRFFQSLIERGLNTTLS
jgi:glycosyltransferase involved in cell wall biosynthesis